MNTTTQHMGHILEAAGFPAAKSQWGHWQSVINQDMTVRLIWNDGAIYMIVFSGGTAMLIHTEAKFSGILAEQMAVATLTGLRAVA